MQARQSARPRSSLHQRHRASTAEVILEAATRCLEDVGLADLNFARIAAAADVAERTIYRHFPTKDALLEAWWRRMQASIKQGPYPETADGLIEAAPTVFPEFDKQAELIRAMLLSPQGRAIGAQTNASRVAAFRRAVRDGAGNLREPGFTRLCAVVQALYSAGTWLTMREVWGLDGKESGRAVSEAIEVLLRRRGRA